MPTLQQRRLKSISNMAVFDKTVTPEVLMIVDTPGSAEVDPGIEELLSTTRSELGEEVVESVEINGQQPLVNCTFPGVSPVLLALRYGVKLRVQEDSFNIEKRVRVAQNAYPAATNGKEGFGMPADQELSRMTTVSDLGDRQELTRLTFAGFDAAGTTDSFAQGADGAWAISDNLIGSDIQYSFPHTQTEVLGLSEDPLSDLRLNFTAIMRDLKIFRIEIPSVSVDRQGSGPIPIAGGEMNLNFRVTYDGSTCTPITYKWIGQARAC
ncbi:MAG: hypothetical protein AAF329_01045 [Cyanobacteria bacterium P01_A01_bin.17]